MPGLCPRVYVPTVSVCEGAFCASPREAGGSGLRFAHGPGLKATSVKPEMKRDPEAIRPTMRAVLSFFPPLHPSFVFALTQFKTRGIFLWDVGLYVEERGKKQKRKQVHHENSNCG